MAPRKPSDNRKKSSSDKKTTGGRVTKATQARKYKPTSHKGHYLKSGRWKCTECNTEMAGTKKTIFWHGQKKHNPQSAYAKDQAAGAKVPCHVMGCKSKTSTANSYLQHHRSAHGFKGDSAGLKAEFRRRQAAAVGMNEDEDEDEDEEEEYFEEPMDDGGNEDDHVPDESDEDGEGDEPGAGAGAPLPIVAA